MPEVRLRQLRKSFGTVEAVDAIDVDVPDGSLMTFLGPSGCGKTTTLRLIAGLERPTGGEVWIGSQRVAGPSVFVSPQQRQIGMVFQSYAVWPHLTVYENVAYPLRVRGMPRPDLKKRVQQALDTVKLGGLGARYPTALSGGQQQRVALARSIVFEPRILLCDEPLSNLDAGLREEMRVEIRELQQRMQITCIYVTHDQREALAVSDLITVMEHGNLLQTGTPEEVYKSPRTSFVAKFLGHNVLDAELVDANRASILGNVMQCQSSDVPVGTSVVMTFRPEGASIVEEVDSDRPNVFHGILHTLSYTGEYYTADVQLDDAKVVRVRSSRADRLDRGMRIAFHVPANELHVVPLGRDSSP